MTTAHAKLIATKAIAVAARFDPHTGFPYHWFVQETNTEGKQSIGRPRKSVAKK
jgi:hypothetical protein